MAVPSWVGRRLDTLASYTHEPANVTAEAASGAPAKNGEPWNTAKTCPGGQLGWDSPHQASVHQLHGGGVQPDRHLVSQRIRGTLIYFW